MGYDEKLAARVRALLADRNDVGERKMFGGLTFMVAGHMCCGVNGDVLTTDGPFAEAKEHLGGFYIIEADDLDAALAWASKTSAAVAKPIEVRPFRHVSEA